MTKKIIIKEKYMKSVNVFIFRRDLRVVDNLALIALSKETNPILPIFIFNSQQIDPNINKYYSRNSVEFMVECLKDLKTYCSPLTFFHGNDIDILNSLLTLFTIDIIAFNEDYTPYARKRDQNIKDWCNRHGINIITKEDYTLFPIRAITTDGSKPYSVYTPFYRKCISKVNLIAKPIEFGIRMRWVDKKVTDMISNKISTKRLDEYYGGIKNVDLLVHGGRENALDILDKIKMNIYRKYDEERDYPGMPKTTRLSAYMKFGCVSVREVFNVVLQSYGLNHGLIRELIWREFYAIVLYYNPWIIEGRTPYKKKFLALEKHWNANFNENHWEAWCNGTTGFPLVDAAMKELNTTGWQHNRCRMICASFLCKDLFIDYRMGERYYATTLVDYDISSNNGGWSSIASVGTDAQPYFRIMNPWVQSKKFDKDCVYIKRWLPELKTVKNEDIHNWCEKHVKYPHIKYPRPIVDHHESIRKTIDIYSKI